MVPILLHRRTGVRKEICRACTGWGQFGGAQRWQPIFSAPWRFYESESTLHGRNVTKLVGATFHSTRKALQSSGSEHQ
jgi:hypothetical protein